MVAWIVLITSRATPEIRFFFCLDASGPSEEPAGRDANGDEWAVIREPAKVGTP